MESAISRTGGCACGNIRFEVVLPLMGVGSCHCTDCQKASGGGPNYVALVLKEGLKVLKGTPQDYASKAASGVPATRSFCGDCGTPLWSTPSNQPFHPIKIGAFDDTADLMPQMQIYVSSAPAWHRLNPDLPSFPKMPPEGKP